MLGNRTRAGAIRSLGIFSRACLGAVARVAVALSCASAPVLADQVETVRFADPRLPAVTVVRGVPSGQHGPAAPAMPVFRKTATNTELVSFGDGTGRTVAVVRGSGLDTPAAPSPGAPRPRFETVTFADPLTRPVAILRGAVPIALDSGLFPAANGGELDRVAFAIDGVESGHGSTPLMWRDDPLGPQGPMQVSAAAALDVGGGDRFDITQNRIIGRAFIAKLYERYGNWPDAIAAYNWGPGHVDQWIAAGRPIDRLPLETTRYLARVLHDAFLTAR